MVTPKEHFLISGKAPAWATVVAKVPELDTACDYALLELLSQMPANTQPQLPTDPYVGLDANAQMCGARRVLEILKTIAEPIKPSESTKRESLHY